MPDTEAYQTNCTWVCVRAKHSVNPCQGYSITNSPLSGKSASVNGIRTPKNKCLTCRNDKFLLYFECCETSKHKISRKRRLFILQTLNPCVLCYSVPKLQFSRTNCRHVSCSATPGLLGVKISNKNATIITQFRDYRPLVSAQLHKYNVPM